MAGVEALEFGLHGQVLELAGDLVELARRVGHDVVALAEVHRAHVDGGDLGQALADVGHAFGGPGHVGALLAQRQRGLDPAEGEVGTGATGEVEHDVGVGLADAVGELLVEVEVAALRAGVEIADVAVHHRGAGLGRLDRRVGDLLGRDGHVGRLADGVAAAGDGAGDEDAGHGGSPSVACRCGHASPSSRWVR